MLGLKLNHVNKRGYWCPKLKNLFSEWKSWYLNFRITTSEPEIALLKNQSSKSFCPRANEVNHQIFEFTYTGDTVVYHPSTVVYPLSSTTYFCIFSMSYSVSSSSQTGGFRIPVTSISTTSLGVAMATQFRFACKEYKGYHYTQMELKYAFF